MKNLDIIIHLILSAALFAWFAAFQEGTTMAVGMYCSFVYAVLTGFIAWWRGNKKK